MPSVAHVDEILKKIIEGVAPPKFTVDHLKGLGFSSSNDRAIIPVLKDLGFLTADGAPTPRYHAFRDRSRSRAVMAEALRDAYGDVFHVNERPSPRDRHAIEGLFKSKLNSSDRVAYQQTATFLKLLANADLDVEDSSPSITVPGVADSDGATPETHRESLSAEGRYGSSIGAQLHYTIQIHLPPTKEIEVYNAIFRSLRENLLA